MSKMFMNVKEVMEVLEVVLRLLFYKFREVVLKDHRSESVV